LLSQKAKYALRALLMLARQKPGEMVLVGDIAEEQSVPKKSSS
jgi:DNA-binding IscR family transcriptional regulator